MHNLRSDQLKPQSNCWSKPKQIYSGQLCPIGVHACMCANKIDILGVCYTCVYCAKSG